MGNIIRLFLSLGLVLFVLTIGHHARAEETATKPSVKVTVYAVSWCPYCKKLRADLKAETGTDQIIRVDETDVKITWLNGESQGAAAVGVKRFPTTFVMNAVGQTSATIVGSNIPSIKEAVRKLKDAGGVIAAPETKTEKPSIQPVVKKKMAGKKSVPAKTPETKVRYYSWFFDENDGRKYCLETNAHGAVLDANVAADVAICEELYGSSDEAESTDETSDGNKN